MSSDPQNPMIINFVFLFSFFLHDFTPNVRTEWRQGNTVFYKSAFNENMVTAKIARPLLSTQVTCSALEIKLDRDSMAYTLHLSGGNRSCRID